MSPTSIFLKLVILAVFIGICFDVYNSRVRTSKLGKPYTLKELYLSGQFIREGIITDCKNDTEIKYRHLRTLDSLRYRLERESLERAILTELRSEIDMGAYKTQFESSTEFYQREISSMKKELSNSRLEYQAQRQELIKLENENKKLKSHLKFNRRL